MAPASEEAPVFDPPQPTPAPALAPAPAPASDSIAPSSSKRRWSPCTWRYAIEEGQPELGSRPRTGSHSQLLYSATVSSTRKSDHESFKINKKVHHSHQHHQQQHYHRHQPKEALKKRPKLEEEGTDDECNDEKEEGERNHLYREDDEGDDEKEEELSRDRIEYSYGNENSKRRRQTREMSPSEIYFCEFCSAKAKASASGLRLSRSKRSPSHVPES